MQAIQAAASTKTYAMDNYDGGRAAAEPEHFTRSELGWVVPSHKGPEDDDVRALAAAIIALTRCGE